MHERAAESARSMEGTRRALIVHRQRLFADALTRVLERVGLAVTVTVPRLAQHVARDVSPHVALVQMDDRASGLSIAHTIRALRPHASLIAVAAVAEPRLVREGRAAGFRAFVTEDMPLEQLLDVLGAALDGSLMGHGTPGAPTGIAPSSSLQHTSEVSLLASQLTDREWDVLEMLIEGASGHQIADRLGVRANTVRSHVQRILTKLQVHSRLEAAGFAVRNGLVRPSPRGEVGHRGLRERSVTPVRSSP
jgi:two-component system, NarL family, nitrate/nitrite response regulator NarL